MSTIETTNTAPVPTENTLLERIKERVLSIIPDRMKQIRITGFSPYEVITRTIEKETHKTYKDLLALNETLEFKWKITPHYIWQPDTMNKEDGFKVFGRENFTNIDDLDVIYNMMKDYLIREEEDAFLIATRTIRMRKLIKDKRENDPENMQHVGI